MALMAACWSIDTLPKPDVLAEAFSWPVIERRSNAVRTVSGIGSAWSHGLKGDGKSRLESFDGGGLRTAHGHRLGLVPNRIALGGREKLVAFIG